MWFHRWVFLILPEAFPKPRPRPIVEYEKDIIAATMESHQIRSKLGICDNMTCTIPKNTMYMKLDSRHAALSPSAWKQSDLFIALCKQKMLSVFSGQEYIKGEPCIVNLQKRNSQGYRGSYPNCSSNCSRVWETSVSHLRTLGTVIHDNTKIHQWQFQQYFAQFKDLKHRLPHSCSWVTTCCKK